MVVLRSEMVTEYLRTLDRHDCELGHFYSHRHPKASFVNHLVVSRILDNEIRSLRDLEYRVVSGAETQIKQIGGPQQLTKILVEELGVQVTAAEGHRLFDGLCS